MSLPSDIGFITAFLGGLSSFFSIWQFCIMQISPFFIAFIVGAHLIMRDEDTGRATLTLLLPGLGYMMGFSILFALLGAGGLAISGYLLYYIRGFRIVSGTFIILVGIMMAIMWRLRYLISPSPLLTIMAPFLGMAFAFAYSPCIPPTLSQLMNYASMSENMVMGAVLLAIYGFGLSTAFVTTAILIALTIGWAVTGRKGDGLVLASCAFLLMVLGIMVTTGLMTYYKAFLLGFFVK